jgi:meso-butanediol dehydrogenase/(S,S)-butanediol dehydrogenase/diacetyl reductase
MGRLAGRAALITGGSGGIGSATVRRFVAEGAACVCADLDTARGRQLVDELERSGARATFVRCDVSEPEEVTSAVQTCVDRYGRIDVLFNNAASTTGGYVADLDIEGFEHSLKVMLHAALYGMQAAIPHMTRQGGGSIISTASVYGLVAGAANAPYCTAKAGLINLSRTAAVEYGRKKIRVNTICPGVVDTAMMETVLSLGLKTREELANQHALGRVVAPEEVADLALFLASDESSAITGQAIVIDAGLLAQVDLTGLPPAP